LLQVPQRSDYGAADVGALVGALDVREEFGVRDGFTVCQWYAWRCYVG
jgi:hypothetical protein